MRGIRKTLFGRRIDELKESLWIRARLLRKRATQPERILWRHLRNRNFAGYKFRRQHPFDDYVLDFYCPSAKLAVELNGGGITIVQAKLAIERGQNSWHALESLSCDSGITRFARSSIAYCKRSGPHSRSGRKTIPHLHPLPLAKGEARCAFRL